MAGGGLFRLAQPLCDGNALSDAGPRPGWKGIGARVSHPQRAGHHARTTRHSRVTRLFSSQAPGFVSEPAEVQEALETVSQTLTPLTASKTITQAL